jgi:glucose/arabinose dehydrogenase
MHEAIQYFAHLHPLFTMFAPKGIHAQLPPKAKIYATGLDGPRGLKVGPDGKLYVSNLGARPPLEQAWRPCRRN